MIRRWSPRTCSSCGRGFEAVLAGDLATVVELLDPQVKWHGGEPADGCQNREQALGFTRAAASRRGPVRLADVIDGGDRLVVVLEVPDEDGTGGRRLRANVTTVRDGLVVEMVAYQSPETALAAAGAVQS